MHEIYPLIQKTRFPAIYRGKLNTLQINLGYKCNQTCLHCHVNAGPKRKEIMGIKCLKSIDDLKISPEVVEYLLITE